MVGSSAVARVFVPTKTYLALAKICKMCIRDSPYTEAGYFDTIRRIADAVKNNVAELVLMGIKPTYPSAKYGYVVPAKRKTRFFLKN